MVNYKEVGKRIRNARAEKKITQEKFAEMLGVSTGYISQVESGQKCFNLKRFNEIVDIFDKPISYFVEGTDTPEQSTIKEITDLLYNVDANKLNIIKNVIMAILGE